MVLPLITAVGRGTLTAGRAAGRKPRGQKMQSSQNKLQNVQRREKQTSGRYETKTVSGDFGRKKSIRARARSRTKKPALNGALHNTNTSSSPTGRLAKQSARSRFLPERAVVATRLSDGHSLWFGLSAAYLVYVFQLWFSIAMLVGFFAEGLVHYAQTETLVGQFVSYFVDVQKYFPGDNVGYFFLGVLILLVSAAFGVFYGLYRARGINPQATPVSKMTTMFCYLFSFLPVTSLFPWIMFWVLYVKWNISALRNDA